MALINKETLIAILAFSIILCVVYNRILYHLFKKYHVFDNINARSSHNQMATRSGGVAIFLCLTTLTFSLYAFDFQIFDFSLLLPISIIALIGLYDDVYSMDFKFKFLFTFILAKVLIDQGLVLESFYLLDGIYYPNYFLAQIITGITLVGVIHSINLIDGIDGLAIGYSIIILLLVNLLFKDYELFYLNSIVIAILIPQFIINNYKKTKIFLGDTGSLILGTIIAINFFTVIQPRTVFSFGIDPNKILFSWLLLFFPLTDLLRVFIFRIKQNISPFEADNNHLHHIVLNQGFSHLSTSLLILSFVLINSFLGYISWTYFDEFGLLGYLLIISILYIYLLNKKLIYNL